MNNKIIEINEQEKIHHRSKTPKRSTNGHSSVDDFQVIKKIGEGTYSTVYKVRRIADEQIYALKRIKLDNMSKKDQESALNQVRILASINQENIIAYRETFYQKGCLFLVLQYAQNGDLLHQINKRVKQRQHFSQVQIWQLLLQVTLGLYALHSQNIIHRDIKPANIFLSKQGVAKLGDLNVSKIINNLCKTQAGTPYYASPQIWKDEPYDIKSDIWSLGCTIYEMAALCPPFLGKDLQNIYYEVTEGTPPLLPLYYSKQLHRIVGKMLQKKPERRISTLFILKNIQRIMPEIYRNLKLAQKVKEVFLTSNHKHTSSLQLLKTITFPSRKSRRDNRLQVNSYLPSPSYSRDNSLHETMDFSSKVASVTMTNCIRNMLMKQKRSKITKGVSLYANIDKQNSIHLYKKEKQPIRRDKNSELPQIKKKRAKKRQV